MMFYTKIRYFRRGINYNKITTLQNVNNYNSNVLNETTETTVYKRIFSYIDNPVLTRNQIYIPKIESMF